MNLKKGLSVLLVLSILLAGSLIACAKEPEGPTTLKFAAWFPLRGNFALAHDQILSDIETRTGGRVVF